MMCSDRGSTQEWHGQQACELQTKEDARRIPMHPFAALAPDMVQQVPVEHAAHLHVCTDGGCEEVAGPPFHKRAGWVLVIIATTPLGQFMFCGAACGGPSAGE
eukprot:8640730-Alexandrium_andersonii.AAC.1